LIPATLALLGVIGDIARAYADAAKMQQHAAAIAADIEHQNFAKAGQDLAALFATITSLISAGLPLGPAKSLDDYKNLFKTCHCRQSQIYFRTTPCSQICGLPGPIRW
jgi:hypothetical protein